MTASTLEERHLPRARAAFSSLFSFLPLNPLIDRVLNVVGLPEPARPIGRAVVLGTLQVFSIEIAQPSLFGDPLNFGLRSLYIGGILHVTSSITKSCLAKLPFVPVWVWGGAFAYLLDRLVQRLARFGFIETARQTILDWAGFFLSFSGELPETPQSATIPAELECCICRELLKYPVEVLGHHICGKCLSDWFEQGALVHPMTGEPISREQVSRALLMTLISNRYRSIVIRDYSLPQ
jgi:hypothetical protein